jgi:hypothetical protein
MKIQAIVERHFELFRQRMREPALQELQEIERSLVRDLQAQCATEVTLADLEAMSAMMGQVQRTRRQIGRYGTQLERVLRDGV